MVKADANIKNVDELEKIRKNEALLANLLENSSQPFSVGYPNGQLGLVNKTFEELTGYSMEELKSTDWSEILTPHEFRDMENEKLEELQRTGQPVRYEKEYIRKDGTRVPIELLMHIVKNENGTPEYYYSFITDISERKISEKLKQELLEKKQQLTEELTTSYEELKSTSEELHKSNEELQQYSEMLSTIYELNPDAIVLTTLSDSKIIDCNQEYLNQIGYSREETIGHTSIELNLLTSEERNAYIDATRGKKSVSNYELRVRRKDGSLINVQYSARHITINNEPIILNIGHDITERNKTEENLKESEERLRLAQNLGNVGIWDWNTITDELHFTPELEQLYGLTPGTIKTYQDWRQLTHPDDIEKIEVERDNKIAKNEPFDLEFRIFHNSGDIHWLSAKGGAIYDNQGSVIRVLGVNTDITDRKHAELLTQKLLKNEQQLTEELTTSNEELQSTSEELQVSNEELIHQGNRLLQINKALEESEERFHDLADNIPNLAWMADATGWIFWYNTQWFDYTGTTLEEMQGWGWQKVHHPDYVESITDDWASNIKAGKPYDNIFPLKGKDGNYRWFLTRVTPIRDEQGKLLRWFGTNTDITELKKSEEHNQKLLESEQQLTEELTTSNEELQSTSEELQTSNEELRYTTEELQISNENLRKVLKNYDQLNHTLMALRDSSFAMMHANDEDFYLDEVCRIIIEDCGHSMVWIGFTEEESKKVFPVAYSGFEEDYLKTLNITCDDTERGQGPTGTAIRTGNVYICENMFTDPKFKPWRQEATKRGYASSIVLPLINDNRVFGALNIYSKEPSPFSEEEIDLLKELTDDISYGLASLRLRIEHEKAEKVLKESLIEVERSNAELEQFAYITSHDLREPLRMITSFLQLLERRYGDQLDQDANEFIGFAVDGAKRLDAMINDILIYSRVSNKERNLTTVDNNEVIQEVYVNLAASIEDTNAEITYDSLPSIITDKQLMIQLFQNLISNAIKYRSEETPKIHISATKEKNQYLFTIKDNGIGISPEHLEKIFTIFQRLHTRDEYEGTGIGLAIAQKIVHQQGGYIWAESKLGKGSTFYFTIPIKE
ncbi:PAS domain S-box protein [Methanobacterium spitsbergense]|uniref:histidine kinase n=1 Tax=Methanobacterium spitsbergense TaxID=2874285 RepID=A0A8T5UVB8_9EURY|nr:PAS domain S-box protein [Methanobacterium spitsbergense]MBZ2164599.1 PAS domain S-box protein [Methanobacterium spitsbergense]